jgi:hypothetical protein
VALAEAKSPTRFADHRMCAPPLKRHSLLRRLSLALSLAPQCVGALSFAPLPSPRAPSTRDTAVSAPRSLSSPGRLFAARVVVRSASNTGETTTTPPPFLRSSRRTGRSRAAVGCRPAACARSPLCRSRPFGWRPRRRRRRAVSSRRSSVAPTIGTTRRARDRSHNRRRRT